MITSQQHAKLLRELAASADHDSAQLQMQGYATWAQQIRDLATRARQAAKEIEQGNPTISVAIGAESMAELRAMVEDVAARQVAEEIEGRKVPSDEDILSCRSWSSHGPTFDSDLVQFGRDLLARFGGGEIE